MPKILLVQGEPDLRDVLEDALSRDGLETVFMASGEKALERLKNTSDDEEPFDLVVLDVMLPDKDGLSMCQELRKDGGSHRDVPVIMLSDHNDEASVVLGLEAGTDDYVTKPFSPQELTSRVRAHLRRRKNYDSSLSKEKKKPRWLEFPGLEIDLLNREVYASGEPVELTQMQFEVLRLLASEPGRVYDREQIMRHLNNGEDFLGDLRGANVFIQKIRKKIEPDPENPRYIQTVRGFGYRFAEL